ncbi:hypothetical protein I3843_05G084200 [Carya illinoinensis]|nr:hypothetical protein I3843_05G084200 [Carya illinoinensis]
MNTRGRGSAACGNNCGCPVPCPGGVACRSYYKCTPTSVQSTTSAGDEHTTCSCGEHCGCNPAYVLRAWIPLVPARPSASVVMVAPVTCQT